MTAAVEFREVRYRAGGREVLRGLDLRVETGETLALLGRSGSGKTTALRLVNALVLPEAGDVLVDGRATRSWDPIALRRGIGYAIQDVGLFPHFTVEENVGLVPSLLGWPPQRIRDRVREVLGLVGLSPHEFGARRASQLSGGQRQRVGVARALAGDPPLLLFDEPFGALDPVTRLEVRRMFVEVVARLGKTAIFVTHDVREALDVATRVAVLAEGKLEGTFARDEFLSSPTPEARAFRECLGEAAPVPTADSRAGAVP